MNNSVIFRFINNIYKNTSSFIDSSLDTIDSKREALTKKLTNLKWSYVNINSPSVPNPINSKSFIEKKPNLVANSRPVSITYEEIGLFPRSFVRVFDRFLKQLFSDVEGLVIEEYRFYRYIILTSFKTMFILLFVPLFVNICSKNYIIRPITEYFWNTKNTEIFLNVSQQKRAFAELQEFEEQLYFDSLVTSSKKIQMDGVPRSISNTKHSNEMLQNSVLLQNVSGEDWKLPSETLLVDTKFSEFESKFSEKAKELAIRYNHQSIEAITNFLGDFLGLLTLCYLIATMTIQINITKAFLTEFFFGLEDSKKSLIILLVTDLLVGYHSPHLWELFFQFLLDYYGFPQTETGIELLVATIPPVLDVLFKYLIFRHLNRTSPATVATYHAMIE